MKCAALPVAVAAVVLALSPVSAHTHTYGPKRAHKHMHGHMQMMCAGDHLTKMTTMMDAMPDSPKKSMMNGHLAMVNSAMSSDGTRGCEMAMMRMMHGSHMKHGSHMMKAGM